MFDMDSVEDAIRRIIEAIGEAPQREGLRQTPRRVAEMYREVFSGLTMDARQALTTEFEEGHQGLVMVKDIPFFSMCEHHFLPFIGAAHVGYLADGRIVGVSKVARLVEALARRPQVQERLTTQVADHMWEALHPKGVAVILRAEHLCMTIRGVRKPGTQVVTSALRGQFCHDPAAREEFMALVGSA
ncbi:MAG: GTP cyclohydrolase I FolE [Dehalococcoidia bacterium]